MDTPIRKQQLFQFAYFRNFSEDIELLANNLADKENWDFTGTKMKSYPILKNYLEHTFRKVKYDKNISYTPDNAYACFNTGLVTPQFEDIYAFFERNQISSPDVSPFYFKNFFKESDSKLLRLFSSNMPPRADFFRRPEELIFNPNCKIIPDIDHIISDNKDRFPDFMQTTSDDGIRRQLMGAIDEIKKRVRTNYKIAIPQYFNGQIQLLLPLCLTPGSLNPDLALAIYKVDDNTYCARTCLTLRMAYGNARLIVKPQSDWLKP